jgi:hypothetical protein
VDSPAATGINEEGNSKRQNKDNTLEQLEPPCAQERSKRSVGDTRSPVP